MIVQGTYVIELVHLAHISELLVGMPGTVSPPGNKQGSMTRYDREGLLGCEADPLDQHHRRQSREHDPYDITELPGHTLPASGGPVEATV